MQEERYHPTEAECAWAAGLFEGEGCIHFRGKTSVCVDINSTDLDVLQKLNTLFPSSLGGIRRMPRRKGKPHHKPIYRWYIGRRDLASAFLLAVLPWLGQRRTVRAETALKRLEVNPGRSRARRHCPKGHPLTGENLYVRPSDGARRCLICRRDQANEYARTHRVSINAAARARYAKRKDPGL